MSWEKEVSELLRRRELAKKMGGPEGIARQHARGKLTVRKRIDALADPGSFRETMALTGSASYDGDDLRSFTPKPSVDGTIELNGRKVVVSGGDFTVRGGSAGAHGGLGQELAPNVRAREWRIPYVRLLDAAGGSVRSFEDIGRTYLPDGNIWSAIDVAALSEVPTVSAVMGSVAGLPAINACFAHFNLMVKDTSQLFPGGPPVVKASLGYDITKEELGGDRIHTRVSGCIDNLARDEQHAFEMIRAFLSYLPSNVWESAPRGDTSDPVERADEGLLDIIPRDPRQVYDAKKLIRSVVDAGSFFEISPDYGKARVTGLARLNGHAVAVMANHPKFRGGSTDVAAGNKVMRLIQLCNTFHLPMVSFADEPGFMVGLESEKQGIERAGARLVATTTQSWMPWLTIVVGRLYGVAGQCQHRASGMFRRYAWPSANWGSMHIAGGASAAYRREIESAPDPAAKRAEIEARLNALASPFRTAEATGQDIIDPRETRGYACEFAQDAQRVLRTQLGPPRIPYLP
ncbi:MAG: carboxyl transferase domain-containing protein [Pseudomonadales bacterium]|jgi:acetyl-CoA carboxylase carboxyltransferase component|nr:carboxyl transferase domain-containing protein [Pseudomonadales bacterium]MDP6473190.1 carboxyl transferase domain-containing protein [Pseudomonadales bacterium]MDP6826050.1 carboxyl transferase domain-containing protein [Pseudomonadales bacterium]